MDRLLLQVLEETGFTNKEARIYLALLELGQASIRQIAEKTELKRSIIYVLIEGLQKRGFVSENNQTKVCRFTAADPIKILGYLQTVTTNFKEMLPMFKGIYNKSEKKPIISYFEGKKAVLSIFREINYSENPRFFTSNELLMKIMPDEVTSWINGIHVGSFIKNAKHIVSDTPDDRYYGSQINGHNGNQVHILPDGKKVAIDLSLYNNKIALTSLTEKLYIIVVESEELHAALSLMFDLAWDQTKSLK